MTFETMTTENNLPETLKMIEKMTTEQAIGFLCAFLTQKAEQINLKDDEIPAFVEYALHNIANI